jgi:hypothetical protein
MRSGRGLRGRRCQLLEDDWKAFGAGRSRIGARVIADCLRSQRIDVIFAGAERKAALIDRGT